MASIVGICNSALIKLGEATITALDEGTNRANAVNEQYDKTRQQLLRSHPWNCAMALSRLARLADAPAFEFSYAYQLPTDWLRTINVSADDAMQSGPEYKIRGRTIHSSAEDIYLTYVKDLEDPNEMDASFRESLAWLLAADVCMALTQSNAMRDQMVKGYDASITQARAADSIEDFPEQELEDEWIACRG